MRAVPANHPFCPCLGFGQVRPVPRTQFSSGCTAAKPQYVSSLLLARWSGPRGNSSLLHTFSSLRVCSLTSISRAFGGGVGEGAFQGHCREMPFYRESALLTRGSQMWCHEATGIQPQLWPQCLPPSLRASVYQVFCTLVFSPPQGVLRACLGTCSCSPWERCSSSDYRPPGPGCPCRAAVPPVSPATPSCLPSLLPGPGTRADL